MPRGNAREKRAYGTQFSGNAQEAEATMNKAVNGLLLAHTVERAQPQLEVIKLLNSLVPPGLPECPVGAIIFGAEVSSSPRSYSALKFRVHRAHIRR